jgi:hypothetical protein
LPAEALQDDGASEHYISPVYLSRLREAVVELDVRKEGWITIRLGKRAERPLPRMRRERVDLTILLGKDYTYSATFTVYDIDTYDIVLGKPWLADLDLRHEIDHKKNRMWIWNTPEEKRRNRACRHTLLGLRPWEGKGRRETIEAIAKE